jgi:hypothetical protein
LPYDRRPGTPRLSRHRSFDIADLKQKQAWSDRAECGRPVYQSRYVY